MKSSIASIVHAFMKSAEGIVTMPAESPLPVGKIIPADPVPKVDPAEARFSEDDGIKEEPSSEKKDSSPSKPRLVQDGFTDQGYRPMPGGKPPRREVNNETDSREWRREYQKEYRENN